MGRFIPVECHTVLFFDSANNVKSVAIANKLSEKMNDVFLKEPTILPTPPNFPQPAVDFPKIILNQDGVATINVSSANAAFLLKFSKNAFDTPNVKNMIKNYVESFTELGKNILRIGFIYVAISEEPDFIEKIKSNYLAPEKFAGVNELEIAWHRQLLVCNLPSNRWIRIAKISKENRLIIDTNTKGESRDILSSTTIMGFINEVLDQYRSDLDAVING